MYTYKYTSKGKQKGFLTGFFFALLFSIRFLAEFVKEDLGGFGENLGHLSTGQWLSIPLILLGLGLIFKPKKKISL
jgi:prolipoprotein diacylglyceryltransferase